MMSMNVILPSILNTENKRIIYFPNLYKDLPHDCFKASDSCKKCQVEHCLEGMHAINTCNEKKRLKRFINRIGFFSKKLTK